MKPLSFLSVKEELCLSLAVLFIGGCFFSGCATVPSEVISYESKEDEAKQGKLSSEKSKQISSPSPQGELSKREINESSSKIQAVTQLNETDSVDQSKSNGVRKIKDLASPNKEGISSNLEIVNQMPPPAQDGNEIKKLPKETLSQEANDDIGSFFSTANSVEKLLSEEGDELNSISDKPAIGVMEGEGRKSGKPRSQIKKRGDESLLDNEKPLEHSISISEPGKNNENATVVFKSKEIQSTFKPKPVIGFSEELQSAEKNDLITNDVSIGFLDNPGSLGGNRKLIRPVKIVGFGTTGHGGADDKTTHDSTRENEHRGQNPRAFGRVRTFLGRGGVSGIEEGVPNETDFKRTKDFLESDRSGEMLNLPVTEQKTEMQYDKTLKWIKSRGRVDGGVVVE